MSTLRFTVAQLLLDLRGCESCPTVVFKSKMTISAKRLRDLTLRSEDKEPSNFGRDAALGTGALGGGALAANELDRKHDDNVSHRPDEEPQFMTDTDRAFPLAGGVISRKADESDRKADELSSVQERSNMSKIDERELGTKDREAKAHGGDGREALAGAASSATTASMPDRSRSVESPSRDPVQRTEDHHGRDAALIGVGSGAAVAAARKAYEAHNNPEPGHEHGGQGHTFDGDPCETSNTRSSPTIVKECPVYN